VSKVVLIKKQVMGCSECKKKKEQKEFDTQENGSQEKGQKLVDIDFNTLSKMDGTKGNYLLKLVIMVVVILALPFIMVILVGQIFFQFFTPKFVPIITQKTNNFFTNLLNKFAHRRAEQQIKKREKQFENSIEYDGIEVFDNANNEE